MKHNPLFPLFFLFTLCLPSSLSSPSSPSPSLSHFLSPRSDHSLELSDDWKHNLLFLKSFCLSFGVVLLPSIGNTIFMIVILLSRRFNSKAGVFYGTLCAQFLLHTISVVAGASVAIIIHHKVLTSIAILLFIFFALYFIFTGCKRRTLSPKEALIYTKHLLEIKGFIQSDRPRQNSTESIVLYGFRTRDVEVSPMVLTPVPETMEEPLLGTTGETNNIPERASQKLTEFKETNTAFDHFLRQRRRTGSTDRRHLCIRCWDKPFFKCFCITLALHYLSAEQFATFTLSASLCPFGVLAGGFAVSQGMTGVCCGASVVLQTSPKLLRVLCGVLCGFIVLQYFLSD